MLLAVTLLPFRALGSEFMPPLREGSLMYMPNTLPSVSLTQQRQLLHVEDSILMTFPEVESVWGKAGRASTATDWAPISMVETTVNLKPLSAWRAGMTQDRLVAAMDQKLRITGAINSWTMPIKNRTDMLSTGIRTTLGIKIFGPDLQVIQRIGHDLEATLAPFRGTASIYAERSFGGRYLDIRPNAEALARYGLTTGDAQETVAMALGGDQVTTMVQGRERYSVQVRYARDFRDTPEAIGRLLVSGAEGIQVPLAQVANVTLADARTIGVQPWEKKMIPVVEKAIRDSDLGLNPATSGEKRQHGVLGGADFHVAAERHAPLDDEFVQGHLLSARMDATRAARNATSPQGDGDVSAERRANRARAERRRNRKGRTSRLPRRPGPSERRGTRSCIRTS